MGVCKRCKTGKTEPDGHSGNLVCTSCGVVQEYDNFQANVGGINDDPGTFVGVGSGVYGYREAKIRNAQEIIGNLLLNFNLSQGGIAKQVKDMVCLVTEGEYGSGRWFPILVGACIYVAVRKENKAVSVVQVAGLVGCDSCEMGRMINRVVEYLELKLPEFDVVSSFRQAISTLSSYLELSEEQAEVMSKQGVFLIQCSMKWWLTTGRRPVPVVAAVLVFVAQLNKVRVKMEEVADKLNVALATCKKRYKELLSRLVKVAQALPWGKSVTVKNIVQNGPSVIQYMELKSSSSFGKSNSFERVRFDLDDLIAVCLNKERTSVSDCSIDAPDSKYFEAENPSDLRIVHPGEVQISGQSLAAIHSKLLEECSVVKSAAGRGSVNSNKRKKSYDMNDFREWRTGQSEMCKKLPLEELLDKDVGLNADPPSYDESQLAYQRRRDKIRAAKSRIEKIMYPSDVRESLQVVVTGADKKRKGADDGNDWEDFIIETLLLHQVREEEIEKGYYNNLLDLHVFHHLEEKDYS